MRGRSSRKGASPSARRVLTKPVEPAEGKPYDNINSDLIVAVDDELQSNHGTRYIVQDLLGQGTFGQVFRCLEAPAGEVVAVKVIKAQPAYFQQARVEVGILQYLNTKADPGDKHHIVRMKDFFVHHSHLCLVFELLSLNLYEVIRRNKFRGFTLPLVRVLINQILDALDVLHVSDILHCDLKPENVLLRSSHSGEVKVIDFGSACFQPRTVYSYIQSRFYRSPEVILGCTYTPAIDMWSLGCLAAELFLGLPLFPGACEHDMLTRITTTLGPVPDSLLAAGRNTHKHYEARVERGLHPASGEAVQRCGLALRTPAEYEAANGAPAPVGKTYFKPGGLADIVASYPMRAGLGSGEVARENLSRAAFLDLLRGVLAPDPAARWTPRQAAGHPFLTGREWGGAGSYVPGAEASARPRGAPVSIPAPRAGGAGPPAAAASPAAGWGAGGAPHDAEAAAAAAAAVARGGSWAGQGWGGRSGAEPGSHHAAALAAALAGTPRGASLGGSFLSPPSRSFAHQTRLLDGGWRGAGDDPAPLDASMPSSFSRLLPLLPPGPLPHGFQPSSVGTYAAALAAAQQAAAQQAYYAQAAAAAAAAQQLAGFASGTPPAATAAAAYALRQHAQRVAQQHVSPQAQLQHAQYAAVQQHLAAQHAQQQQQLAAAEEAQWQAQPSGEWMPTAMMHGSNSVGIGRMTPGDDDAPPEPGDWDPLWSDDLLREEESLAARPRSDASPSAAYARGGSGVQALPSPGMPPSAPYDPGWWRQRRGSAAPPAAGPSSLGTARRSVDLSVGVPLYAAQAQAQASAQAAANAQAQAAAAYVFQAQAQAALLGSMPSSSLPRTLGDLSLAAALSGEASLREPLSAPEHGFHLLPDGGSLGWPVAAPGTAGPQSWAAPRSTFQPLQHNPFQYQTGLGEG